MLRFGLRLWTLGNRAGLVLGAILLALILGGQTAEKYGDRLQIALPLVAYACAISDRKGSELVARFAAVFFASHASKRLLGETGINTRPSGGTHGFPSAHTAAATFGASALVHDCLPKVPLVQAAVILAAGFVGASRIEAGKHDIWQVLAGWILGWGGERALRSGIWREALGRLARQTKGRPQSRRRLLSGSRLAVASLALGPVLSLGVCAMLA